MKLVSLVVGIAALLACTSVGSEDRPASAPTEPHASPTAVSSASAAPTAVTVRRNLTYTTIETGDASVDLDLDLYVPDLTGPRPIVVYVHGGGWFQGSRSDCPGSVLAAATSYALACVDYRLVEPDGCPAWSTFPGAVRDVRSAIDWLRNHAGEQGLDASRLALMGDSSGGHLATLAGLSTGVPDLDDAGGVGDAAPVHAVVDWYGPADIRDGPIVFADDPCTVGVEDLERRYGADTPYFYWTMAWGLFLGGSLEAPAVAARAAIAAPATHADPSDPPVLVIHGEEDSVVPFRQSELLVGRLSDAGVRATLVPVPGQDHSFAGQDGEVSPAFLDPTVAFLHDALGSSDGS